MHNMNARYRQLLMRVLLVLLMIILQLIAARLEWRFNNQFRLLEFGYSTFTIAISAIVLSVASGFILAFFFLSKKQHSESHKSQTLFKAVIWGIFPALVVVFTIYSAMFGPSSALFGLLGPFRFQFMEIVSSQVSPFWLGAVIGGTIKQLLQ